MADYLNSVNSNLKYELQDSSERCRLYNDIYDLVTQGQLVAVFKNFTDDFKDAYFVVPDWKLKSILQDDGLVPMEGNYLIYCYDKKEKLTESESASISHNLAISFDDIYIPRAELDKLFKVGSEKDDEINQLKARNIELEAKQVAFDQSNFDTNSYTTPAIDVMNSVIKKFWIDYSPDQPAPKQSTITTWITDNFEDISPALALNIDKVCRHSDAKSGGKYKRQ